jgi:hypothetical protein
VPFVDDEFVSDNVYYIILSLAFQSH